jgi:hypothetical protein
MELKYSTSAILAPLEAKLWSITYLGKDKCPQKRVNICYVLVMYADLLIWMPNNVTDAIFPSTSVYVKTSKNETK